MLKIKSILETCWGEIKMKDNRIKLSSLKIVNFRSIKNNTILIKDLNIFVGLNDAGKSNILKALNLFFNNETDYGVDFSFDRDFTRFYDEKSHRAKEISIELRFEIPDTYSGSGTYNWKKTWRWDGLFESVITKSNGEKPASKSRIPGALQRIKFRYVPAVKSKDYFKTLLGDLYTAVFSSAKNPLGASVNTFSNELKKHTSDLSQNIEQHLSISSMLSFPEDLNDIFKALIFETKSSSKEFKVPLSARGDGIQAYHIPLILKYIAQKDNESSPKGSMNVCTIWGFEEPENGLELSKSFDMATEFENYAKDLQIFVTTHSPAFFMKKDIKNSQIFYIGKKDGVDETTINEKTDSGFIAEKMGLMPIVAPYIEKQSHNLATANKLINSGIFIDVPTILVEGKYDAELLEMAFKCFSPSLFSALQGNHLRFSYKESTGGCKTLSDWVMSWVYCGFKSKAIAIFDKDEAGLKAKEEVENNDGYIARKNGVHVYLKTLEPSNEIIQLYNQQVNIEYEIEHLLSTDFWNKMIAKQYTLPRNNETILKWFSNMIDFSDGTIEQQINKIVGDANITNTIVFNEVKDEKKGKIINFIKNSHEQEKILVGLIRTVQMIERLFDFKDNRII